MDDKTSLLDALLQAPSQVVHGETRLANVFEKFLNTVSNSVFVISPFINGKPVETLIHWTQQNNDKDVRVLTRLDMNTFVSGLSDIQQVANLIQVGAMVRGCDNLHAKLYLFDKRIVICGSANLTDGGFSKNKEYNIITLDGETTHKILEQVLSWWEHAETTKVYGVTMKNDDATIGLTYEDIKQIKEEVDIQKQRLEAERIAAELNKKLVRVQLDTRSPQQTTTLDLPQALTMGDIPQDLRSDLDEILRFRMIPQEDIKAWKNLYDEARKLQKSLCLSIPGVPGLYLPIKRLGDWESKFEELKWKAEEIEQEIGERMLLIEKQSPQRLHDLLSVLSRRSGYHFDIEKMVRSILNQLPETTKLLEQCRFDYLYYAFHPIFFETEHGQEIAKKIMDFYEKWQNKQLELFEGT